MSIKLINAALELDLPPVKKLLLAVLADIADETGLCWPSIKRIARRTSISIRTAQRVIKELEKQGFIRIEHRFRPDHSQTSNLFHLDLQKMGVTK